MLNLPNHRHNQFTLAAQRLTDAESAATALRAGQLVALPTETVYGLGANALNEAAVAGIFTAKNRPSFDPLIIHQSTTDRILRYAQEVPPAARLLADACWPGPLTLVLPKNKIVPDLVSAGLDTVALRVPDHALTRRVLEAVDFPVAAPSANPFGFVSPTTADHVLDQLGDRIDFVLDGGPCTVGLESTIVAFPDGVATVLRKGGLAVEKLEEILGAPLAIRTHSSSRPEAPGMLSQHYSPGVEMILLEKSAAFYPIGKEDALICFGNEFHYGDTVGYPVHNLSVAGDLTAAAATLFATLRIVANAGYRKVYVGQVPDTGLGRAINDRLSRAAATA